MNEDANKSPSNEQHPREPWDTSRAATAHDEGPAGMPTFEPLDPLVPDGAASTFGDPTAAAPSETSGLYVPDESDEPADEVQWYQSSGRPGELAWLAENFATSFAATAGGLLRADLKVRLVAVAETTRQQFTDAVEDPTCAYSLMPSSPRTASAGAGSADTCLEFSPAIAAELVQRLMGARDDGDARDTEIAAGPQRPLTGAERRVLRHLANLVALGLSVARPGGTRGEMRAELAPTGGDGEDRVVVATFELSLAGRVGTMRLCGPGRLAGSTRAGRTRRASAGPLEITAAIDSLALDAADLDAMEAGDILDTELPADGEVLVRIAGIPKFAGRVKIVDGRRVVTISRRLGPAGR